MTAPSPLLRPGGRRCQCAACGEVFSGPSAFDRHQTMADNGPPWTVCHRPDARGLVVRDGLWSWPSRDSATLADKLRARA